MTDQKKVPCPTTIKGEQFSIDIQPKSKSELIKLLLLKFFSKYDIKRIPTIPSFLQNWNNQEEKLFEKLEKKYAVHPLDYWPEMAKAIADIDINKKKLAVVLDLDETLVHAVLEDEHEAEQPTSVASEHARKKGIATQTRSRGRATRLSSA